MGKVECMIDIKVNIVNFSKVLGEKPSSGYFQFKDRAKFSRSKIILFKSYINQVGM